MMRERRTFNARRAGVAVGVLLTAVATAAEDGIAVQRLSAGVFGSFSGRGSCHGRGCSTRGRAIQPVMGL